MPRLVIIECAGYIFWQLFLRRLLNKVVALLLEKIQDILYRD